MFCCKGKLNCLPFKRPILSSGEKKSLKRRELLAQYTKENARNNLSNSELFPSSLTSKNDIDSLTIVQPPNEKFEQPTRGIQRIPYIIMNKCCNTSNTVIFPSQAGGYKISHACSNTQPHVVFALRWNACNVINLIMCYQAHQSLVVNPVPTEFQ